MAGRYTRTVYAGVSLTKNAKTDVVEKDYIGWAIKNGFQVIDVNIPKIEPIADVFIPVFSIGDWS